MYGDNFTEFQDTTSEKAWKSIFEEELVSTYSEDKFICSSFAFQPACSLRTEHTD